MKLSTRGRYGLRAIHYLAENEDNGYISVLTGMGTGSGKGIVFQDMTIDGEPGVLLKSNNGNSGIWFGNWGSVCLYDRGGYYGKQTWGE